MFNNAYDVKFYIDGGQQMKYYNPLIWQKYHLAYNTAKTWHVFELDSNNYLKYTGRDIICEYYYKPNLFISVQVKR